jgi:hypothetical protein
MSKEVNKSLFIKDKIISGMIFALQMCLRLYKRIMMRQVVRVVLLLVACSTSWAEPKVPDQANELLGDETFLGNIFRSPQTRAFTCGISGYLEHVELGLGSYLSTPPSGFFEVEMHTTTEGLVWDRLVHANRLGRLPDQILRFFL